MRVLFFYKNNESLGIEYLSSVLKEAGHVTDLLFDPSADNYGVSFFDRISGFSFDTIRIKIEEFQPDLIAFSVFTNIYAWAARIAHYIKQHFSIPIIMGGPHPTISPEYVIKNPDIDFIAIGESETCMLKLCEALERGEEDFSEVPNLWYKKQGKIYKNPLAPLITDLDSLPFPDKELFFKFGKFDHPYHIITTRGCPFNCTYCINHQLHLLYPHDPPVRRRSPSNVVKELKWALEKFHIKSIYFIDDNFLVNTRWLWEFARELQKEEIYLPFKCLAHPHSVNPRKLRLLKNMGCVEMDLGVESGSPRIREEIFNRHMKNAAILKSAKMIKEAGIRLVTLNIINNPTETIKDMLMTFKLNREIKPDAIHITSLYPYPNTRIAHICKEVGLMTPEIEEEVLQGVANYRTRTLLPHPYADFGEQIRLFAPLFLKLPQRFHKLIFLLPPKNFFNLINIIHSTSFLNAYKKIREYMWILFRSKKYYKTLRKRSKKRIRH